MQNEGFCTSIQGEWSLVQREIVELLLPRGDLIG